MQERSEEQILSRLFELENGGQAERRVALEGETYIALVHDPDTGRGYVLRHGVDDTEGAEIPPGTEFWEYPTPQAAEQAFEQLVSESATETAVVEEDSIDNEGDFETGGADIRDMYSDEDSDPLVRPQGPDDAILRPDNLSEDDEEPPNKIQP